MRILAFSDLHCDHSAAQAIKDESADADVVIGAGDFGLQGQRSLELFRFLDSIEAPLLIVSGNHDNRSELKSFCDDQSNIHLLDGNAHTVGGVTFFGLGGEIPSRSNADWNETLDEAEAAALLVRAPTHQVLVTHTPPFGYSDLQQDNTHEGSKAITDAIKQHAPLLCLCGHIHYSWGSIEQVASTIVHNLGPVASWHTVSETQLGN